MNDKDIKQAFENMGPRDEARRRMLDNLLTSVQENAIEAPSQTGPTAANSTPATGQETSTVKPGELPRPKANPGATSTPTKQRSRRLITLPIAASLILLLGIGALTIPSLISSPESIEFAASSTSQKSSDSTSEETAQDSSAEILNESTPLSIEESSASGSLNALNLGSEYPIIKTSFGYLYLVDNGQSAASLVDEAAIGQEIEVAIAYTEDEAESISCILYDCPTFDTLSFAVKYEGDDTYYLAKPLAR